MNNKKEKLELLAPAGNLDKMKTAFLYGADAIYLGIPDFSLRVRINNFDLNAIKEAVSYAHKKGKKVYVTVNIFAHNRHFKKLPAYIKKLKNFKIDAFIVSDLGVLGIIKKEWSQAEIHLSTQANCTNWQSAEFWYKQGIKRIILGREVTLNEIKEINQKVPKMELEYFVHGAMCMSYSGRCFLSSYFTGRSANLGDCAQPCRWKFNIKEKEYLITEEKRPNEVLELVEEEHGSYILNSKDLCLLEHLDDLIKAGVTSFKIEGRAKSVYYVATVVGAYRKALDVISENTGNQVDTKKEINFLKKELEKKLTHRGYTLGFLFGQKGDQQINKSHEISKWEFCGVVIKALKHKDTKKRFQLSVKVHNTLKVGDEVEILKPYYDIIKLKIDRMTNTKSKKDVQEAHGGSGQVVVINTSFDIPVGSIIARKVG